MTEVFEDRLRRIARGVPVPEPPSDLIERILSERARGRRVTPPLSEVRPNKIRLYSIGLVAAAVLIIAMPFAQRMATRYAANDVPSSTGDFLIGRAYAAQLPKRPPSPPLRLPPTPPIRAGVHRYVIRVSDANGAETEQGDGVVNIREEQFAGQPAWRVEHIAHTVVDGQPRTEAEVLFVATSDLRLLSRVIEVRPYRRYGFIKIVQRFSGDSLAGEMTTDTGVRRTFGRQLAAEHAPYMADALAPFLLAGIPLSPGWKASLSIVGWAVKPNDVYFPVSLEVVGEETISTATGPTACWKLSVITGAERRLEWVRKSDGLAVRSDDRAASPDRRTSFILVTP